MYKNTHECMYSLTWCEHVFLYCAVHTCVFSTRARVSRVFSGRWRGGRTWLTLHVCQLLLSQVFREAHNSISLHAFCPLGHRFTSGARCFLSDVLLWCLYQNNLIPGQLCVVGALKAMQKKHLRGQSVLNGLHIPDPDTPHTYIYCMLLL